MNNKQYEMKYEYSIFIYSDYRQFLKDYYKEQKEKNPSFSYRYLSSRAGIGSPSFYKQVMEAERNLTRTTITKTIVALGLEDREAEFFEQLVYFNQAKTIKEKNYYCDKLQALQRVRKVGKINEDQYQYFSQWYHPVMRELVCLDGFTGDYEKLGRSLTPAITASQAEHSVKMMLNLGFLKKKGNRFEQTEPVVSTGPGITSHLIVKYQMAMLRMALESFDRVGGKKEKLMSTLTLSLSEASLDLVRKRTREFRAQLLEIARSDRKANRVYHYNLNLFSLSKDES